MAHDGCRGFGLIITDRFSKAMMLSPHPSMHARPAALPAGGAIGRLPPTSWIGDNATCNSCGQFCSKCVYMSDSMGFSSGAGHVCVC
jgi:hypothetical protein